jgi:hypothetical protein
MLSAVAWRQDIQAESPMFRHRQGCLRYRSEELLFGFVFSF